MNHTDYSDIISLPHYEPRWHRRMTMQARAAQFAPFAALNGHDDAIAETARLTAEMSDVGDERATLLNRRMAVLRDVLHTLPQVAVTHFVPDAKKDGGAYRRHEGRLRAIDDYNFRLVMTDGTTIPIQHILDIESEAFSDIAE